MKYYEEQTIDDPFTGRVGQEGHENCPRSLFGLRVSIFQENLYPTPVVCHAGPSTILQNRLPRHYTNHTRLVRSAGSSWTFIYAPPHHPILCQEASFKNENFDRLLSSIFNDAQELGLIEPKAEASIDATGMEARHVSRHYVLRAGYKRFLRYRWPKLTLVCDNDTHLFAAAVVTDGPSQDSPQFPLAMIQACRHLTIDRLLGDAGYDGEHNHRLARDTLGIRSTVIALNKRNSRKWPRTKYRRQMKRRFHCRIFGNRWQVESAISRNKRRLGSALRARTPPSQEQECFLRVITHNLMILSYAA